MHIIIDSPPDLTAYFAYGASQNHVYGVLDGLVMVGWHPDKKEAQKRFNGLVVKIYKDMKGV